MALEECEVTSNSCNSNFYSFDELQDAFDELAIDFENMNYKHRNMISKLNIENEFLLKMKIDLEKQNEELKKNFDICQMKNEVLEKENLDLKMKLEELLHEKQKALNDSLNAKLTKCAHCKFHGHIALTCPIRRKVQYRIRQAWIPKGTRDMVTNPLGPKAIWVPKIK
ncbi:hypothetical protein PTKIN_Ptkin08bG0098300 [Pterospermum kingtungense]